MLKSHKNKDCAKLFDISFNYKYSQKHKTERLEIYKHSYGKNTFDKVVKFTI